MDERGIDSQEDVQRAFGDMREGAMAKIVKQRSQSNQPGVLVLQLANFRHQTRYVENS